MQFFFHYQLILLYCFDCLLALILCTLACIHAVLLNDFPCTHSKFFSSCSFFYYSPYLLVRSSQKNFRKHQKLPSVSNFHLLIVVAGINVMNLLTNRSSWLHVLRLSFSSVNIAKYFVLPLFEDLSVGSKYCYHLAAFRSDWNKAISSIRRVSSSTNAIKSAKLGSLLLPFLIANTCRFRLSLTFVKLCNH